MRAWKVESKKPATAGYKKECLRICLERILTVDRERGNLSG